MEDSAENSLLQPYGKGKIGSHLCYPIQFSETVSALAQAVEGLQLKVCFRGRGAPRKGQVYEKYAVLSAELWAVSKYRHEASWWLLIRSIPRSLRSIVRPLLLGQGLDHLRNWYSLPRTPNEFAKDQGLHVWFTVASGELAFTTS